MAYTSNEKLRTLIQQAQQGQVSEELTAIIKRIALSLRSRYKLYLLDCDDYAQECICRCLAGLHSCRLDANIFNWLTTVCFNVFLNGRRRNRTAYKMLGVMMERLRPDRRRKLYEQKEGG